MLVWHVDFVHRLGFRPNEVPIVGRFPNRVFTRTQIEMIFNPHVIISSYELMENYSDMQEKISKLPGVEHVYPYVEGQAMMHFDNRVYGVLIKGMPAGEDGIKSINKYIHEGSSVLKTGEIVIGNELAKRQGVKVGEQRLGLEKGGPSWRYLQVQVCRWQVSDS